MRKIFRHKNKSNSVFYELILILFVLSVAYPTHPVEPAIKQEINNPSEYELKAIYLYNFLQFVEWPSAECPGPGEKSKEIGVLGDTSLQPVLKTLQEKLKKKNLQLNLTFYGPYRMGMDLAECGLLFISDSEKNNLEEILARLADKPVLTVSDADNFSKQGVMITLLSYNNKVRWSINRQPVRDAGLRLSAKLLDIAVEVND